MALMSNVINLYIDLQHNAVVRVEGFPGLGFVGCKVLKLVSELVTHGTV